MPTWREIVRQNRIETVTLYAKPLRHLDEDTLKDELTRYIRKRYGVSIVTTRDYVEVVIARMAICDSVEITNEKIKEKNLLEFT